MHGVRSDGVGDRGTDGAARLVRRAEHEVIDEELRTTAEELGERLRPSLGLEAVVLLDRHPGELPPLPRELVAAAGGVLLLPEQLLAGRIEFLLCADPVLGHAFPPLRAVAGWSDYPASQMANDPFKGTVPFASPRGAKGRMSDQYPCYVLWRGVRGALTTWTER